MHNFCYAAMKNQDSLKCVKNTLFNYAENAFRIANRFQIKKILRTIKHGEMCMHVFYVNK